MLWIVDVILLIIFAVVVIVSTVRGFVSTVFDLLLLSASVAVTFFASPAVCRSFPLVSPVLIYALVFVAAYVILLLIGALINKIFSLPGLKTVNRFLGFLLGIGSAYIIMSIAAAVICVFPDIVGAENALYTASQLNNSTVVYRFFSDYGILSLLGMMK